MGTRRAPASQRPSRTTAGASARFRRVRGLGPTLVADVGVERSGGGALRSSPMLSPADAAHGRHRRELVAYCYRMLGSPFEAEDAAQETLERVWRHRDRFDERRGSYRTWVYAIASNVCIDVLRGRQRRLRAMDLAPPARPGDPLGEVASADRWIEPVPDALVISHADDPAATVAVRESIRLAFVAALQHLPARQRATLILRDVLAFSAAEVAQQLDTSVPAVNSALQRARATLARERADVRGVADPADPDHQELLARYVAAFERHDVDTLVTLLRKDASMAMPPLVWWLRGRDQIAAAWRADPAACAGTRMVGTAANGGPAFAQYVWSERLGWYEPRSLTTLELVAGRIQRLTVYLDTAVWFPLFDFSDRLGGPPPQGA